MTQVNRAMAALTVKQIGKNLRNLNKSSAEYKAFRQEMLCSLVHQMQHSGSGAELLKNQGKGVDLNPSIFNLFAGAKEKAQASAFLTKFGPVRSFFDGTRGGIKYDSSLAQNKTEGAVEWARDLEANENPLFLDMLATQWDKMEDGLDAKEFTAMTEKERTTFAAKIPEADRAPYTAYINALAESKKAVTNAQTAKVTLDKAAAEAFKLATTPL